MKQLLPVLILITFLCCESKKGVLNQETYEGPSVAMDSIDMKISDSTITKIRLKAPKQYVYENKDRDFPDGIFLTFYDENEKISSTLEANTGYYFMDEDYYKAEGDVKMISLDDGNELNTELLNWDPNKQRIYTDNFVTIKTDGEVLKGEGLEAKEDFSEYTILKPIGVMSVGPKNTANDESGFDNDLEYVEPDSLQELD